MSSSASLSVAVAHAITFLTRPLIVAYPATTVIKLQLVLEANLTALFAPTWVPKEPLRGSGRRCLTLSPNCLPPRAIYAACLAADVQWFDWIARLGGREFDMLVDPSHVSVRVGSKSQGSRLHTVWSGDMVPPSSSAIAPSYPEVQSQIQPNTQADTRAPMTHGKGRTLAQQILEEDREDDEELFAMLADEISAPTWMTPVVDQFPVPARSDSPLSTISADSRSSSRSSNSTSTYSFASYDSFHSRTTVSTQSSPAKSLGVEANCESALSRRERARQARVYVDKTKKEVTPYDGGKTTVLTGGVMLGPANTGKSGKTASTAAQSSQAGSWRAARA